VAWTPEPAHAVWASASRAVRTPSRGEADARLNIAAFPGPTEVALMHSHDFTSEKLTALELGYRVQPVKELSFDVATFYNFYDDLRTFEPDTPFLETTPGPPHTVQPFVIDNKMMGRSYGVEISALAQPLTYWRMQLAYTFLRLNLIPDSSSRDPAAENAEHESPGNQVYFRSSWDLPENFQLDVMPRYVGVLGAFDVPAYVELDARLAWRLRSNLEVSLTGQNLIHRSHVEFAPALIFTEATAPERGGFLMVSMRF